MTNTTNTELLKPCPFCGQPGFLSKAGSPEWFSAGCSGLFGCPAYLRAQVHRTEAEATAAWNRRAALAEAGEQAEKYPCDVPGRCAEIGRKCDRCSPIDPEWQAVPQGWLPIETAPKDGRTVLVWPYGDRVDVDHWSERIGWLPGVTHWMPLPAPPGAAAPEAPAAPTDANRDAYEGCREDLLDWKRRALVAEENNRQLIRAMRAEFNGPTFMGEPAAPAVAVEGVGIHRLMKSEQGAFVPASEWFTGNPDPSWEKLVADEPDSWRIQRRVTGKQIATGIAKAFATPYVASAAAAEPDMTPFDAVESAMRKASLLAGAVAHNNTAAADEYAARLRRHLVRFMYPPAPREPLTDERCASACLSYRHDFGLLGDDERKRLMGQAREWGRAFGIGTDREGGR